MAVITAVAAILGVVWLLDFLFFKKWRSILTRLPGPKSDSTLFGTPTVTYFVKGELINFQVIWRAPMEMTLGTISKNCAIHMVVQLNIMACREW